MAAILGWFSDARTCASRSTCAIRSIVGKRTGQDFDRDITPELGIQCSIDLAHASGTDQ